MYNTKCISVSLSSERNKYMSRKKLLSAKHIFLLIIIVSMCFTVSCTKKFTLAVTVLSGDGFTVSDTNPKQVEYGKDVSFVLDIDSGKTVVALTDGSTMIKDYTFADGVLTVKNITAPKTFTVSVGDSDKKCEFWISSSSSRGGGATSSVEQGRVAKGTVVTVTASPNDGAIFLGWSLNKSVKNGGNAVSLKEQYTFKVDESVTLYANYDASNVTKKETPKVPKVEVPNKKPNRPQPVREKVVEVIYDANGGKSFDGAQGIKTDFCIDYYLMPNTMPENGSFAREGYVLTGYNTKADGSGTYVGMGHKIKLESDAPLVLYCMWQQAEPETSFTVSETNGNISVEKYNGSSKEVYIPKTLGGKPVVKIASGAFAGSGVEKVYIPSSVVNVEDGAFAGSKALSEVTFFDSLFAVSDASFENCPIKTINLHAAKNPRYSDSDLSFSKKYERFMTADKARIIIVSGSSKHFGFDTGYAEELLSGGYSVVNYGTNAQMNVVFFLEALANLADKDDTIIFAPEQYGPFCDTVNGNPQMTALTFQGCESCYDLLSYADMTKYTEVFTAYSQYSKQRSGMGEKTYETRSLRLDEYGDCAIPRPNLNSENYKSGANGTFLFKEDTIPVDFAANVNRILDIAKKRNVKAYLSYPPYNVNSVAEDCLDDESYDAYNADMRKVISVPLISDVRDYIFEGKYFYNTDYHLGDEGTVMHTEQVCDDILDVLD